MTYFPFSKFPIVASGALTVGHGDTRPTKFDFAFAARRRGPRSIVSVCAAGGAAGLRPLVAVSVQVQVGIVGRMMAVGSGGSNSFFASFGIFLKNEIQISRHLIGQSRDSVQTVPDFKVAENLHKLTLR